MENGAKEKWVVELNYLGLESSYIGKGMNPEKNADRFVINNVVERPQALIQLLVACLRREAVDRDRCI